MPIISSLQQVELFRDKYVKTLSELQNNSILINIVPNRSGKTFTTLDFFSKQPGKHLYLSDRHEQISELVPGETFRHWYGLNRVCERRNEPFIAGLIAQGLHANVICKYFCKKSSCNYKNQFNIPNNVVVMAPKEFLPTKYIQDTGWDTVILDENIEKAQKIGYTYPYLPSSIFKRFIVDSDYYKTIGNIIQGKEEPKINELIYGMMKAGDLPHIIKMIKCDNGGNFSPTNDQRNLINYLNNLNNTVEWIKYCQKYGQKEHYYKPYLHDAFNLLEEYSPKLIILNTSLDNWVYKQLSGGYKGKIPEPQYIDLDLINKDSILLHYNYYNRSCSKEKITINGKKLDGPYGAEIHDMVKRTINFAHKRELKVGVITIKSLTGIMKENFGSKLDVVGYFKGHQGSNKFDDVDVLIIIGTFNIRATGLYHIHYIITNEFLKDNPAKWNEQHTINGMHIQLTDNMDFNRIKLYKLNEEHQQAIFRSGAHVHSRKLVVSFGYVPEGVENILTYHTFSNRNQLIARLNSIKDKIGPLKVN